MKVYVDSNDYVITYCGMTGRESLETSKTPMVVENISDYTKQVRKEVCEEIIEEVKKLIDKDFKLCNHEYANGYCYGLQYDLAKILEQIEKGENKWI